MPNRDANAFEFRVILGKIGAVFSHVYQNGQASQNGEMQSHQH